MFEVLDPTYNESAEALHVVSRPDSLEGLTLGIVSNGKQGTATFFDALSRPSCAPRSASLRSSE